MNEKLYLRVEYYVYRDGVLDSRRVHFPKSKCTLQWRRAVGRLIVILRSFIKQFKVHNLKETISFWFCSTMILMIVFSQYIVRVDVPCAGYSRVKKCHLVRYPVFKLYPVSHEQIWSIIVLKTLRIHGQELFCVWCRSVLYRTIIIQILLGRNQHPRSVSVHECGNRYRVWKLFKARPNDHIWMWVGKFEGISEPSVCNVLF